MVNVMKDKQRFRQKQLLLRCRGPVVWYLGNNVKFIVARVACIPEGRVA